MNAPHGNQPRTLGDVDAALDRTLRALADTAPDPDLNHRLLAALAAHPGPRGLFGTAPRTGSALFLRTLLASLRRPAFGVGSAVAALAVMALATLLTLRLVRPHPPARRLGAVDHNTAPAAVPPPPAAPGNLQLSVERHPAPPPRARVFHLGTTNVPVPAPRPAPAPASAPNPGFASSAALDAQALADRNAPSQLAPPLPPTAQERLVSLLLRHGERRDLAQLAPAARAAFAAQERSAFHQFFDPPPSPYQLELRRQVEKIQGPAPPAFPDALPPVAEATPTAPAPKSQNAPGDPK